MRRFFTIALFLAAANLAAAPTVDEIIGRYIAARGGIEKLHAIQSLVYRGVYTEGSHTAPHAAMSLMRPYLKLVGDAEHLNPDFAEGYDGSAWEFYGDPGVVVRTVGAASSAGRHATSIDGPLVDYASRGWTVELAGIEPIGDRKAWRLVVTMPDGFRQEEFIDVETYLLIAERKTAPIHAFGERVRSEERIGDYREVAGVLFAFAHREVEIATGKVLSQMQWNEIVANDPLDPAAFSPPQFTRTPLQAFLEQLYAQRTDVQAVLWSYRDFRLAWPAVDTRGGIEFIGYQMLKMGDVAGATALLERNAADYPTAATSAFALGRAYLTAGKTEAGKREMERALALDPHYERAKEALAATTTARRGRDPRDK